MSDTKQHGAPPHIGLTGARRPAQRVDHFHTIYDPAELASAIRQLKGATVEPVDYSAPAPADAPSLTVEDANRLRVLERIAADPRGHNRRSIAGSADMVRRLSDLATAMPHFAVAIDVVARAALAASRTATPLRLPPILLLGAAGTGKTYTMRAMAGAIGAEFSLVAANLTDSFRLRGLPVAYRGAKMGRISEILLGASTTPVVLVDEIDKAIGDTSGRGDGPYDSWHSLLERENAKAYRDDYLEVDVRADQILWFASANNVSGLPASILDRFLIIDIPTPSRDQLGSIVASIYAMCRGAYGGALPEQLAEDVADELARHNPRRIGRMLDLAVGFAAADGRRSLNVADGQLADRLAGAARHGVGFRGRVGFTRP